MVGRRIARPAAVSPAVGGFGRRVVAIDDVVLFLDAEPARAPDLVGDRDDDEKPRAPVLDRDLLDPPLADDLLADQHVLPVGRAAAAEHAPRQGRGGQETAALGMAVRADARRRHARVEIAPVAHRPDGIAHLRHVRLVEQGGQAVDLHGRGEV